MKSSTIRALVSYINGETIDNLNEIKAELEAELSKGDTRKAATNAVYDAAQEVVLDVLRATRAPLTAAEIFAECENDLPEGFTKGKLTYGLAHQFAPFVVKVEGKVNTYRLKE